MQKEWRSTVIKEPSFCNLNGNWDPRYMLCLKSEFPITKTVTFNRKKTTLGTPIDWKKPLFVNYDNTRSSMNGYRVPCSGDSGSGQVVLTSINKNSKKQFRYVLAAIYDATISDDFTDDDGTEYGIPCGSYTRDDRTKKVLHSAATAQSTSWPDIFAWIKDMADIKQSSE